MRENRSYVFFQELTGPGPLGALGRPVTRQCQVAADPRFVPLGAPVLLAEHGQSAAPTACGSRRIRAARSAGANRFDTFWGAGRRGGGDRRRRCRRAGGPTSCCRAPPWSGSGAACARSALRSRRSGGGSSRASGRCTGASPTVETERRPEDSEGRRREPAAPEPARKAAPGTTLDGSWDRRLSRGLVQPDRTARSARPQSRHRLRSARPAAGAGDRRRATGCCCWSPASRARAPSGAARSARRSATGSPPRAMPATSPRCAAPIPATAARARSTSCSGAAARHPGEGRVSGDAALVEIPACAGMTSGAARSRA